MIYSAKERLHAFIKSQIFVLLAFEVAWFGFWILSWLIVIDLRCYERHVKRKTQCQLKYFSPTYVVNFFILDFLVTAYNWRGSSWNITNVTSAGTDPHWVKGIQLNKLHKYFLLFLWENYFSKKQIGIKLKRLNTFKQSSALVGFPSGSSALSLLCTWSLSIVLVICSVVFLLNISENWIEINK